MTGTLIRKNLRVQRSGWLAMIVLSLLCWPVAAFGTLAFSSHSMAELLQQRTSADVTQWVSAVTAAGLFMMCVISPTLTGMAVATERQERSAEFEFMLPISPRRRVWTKLAAALIAATVLLLVQTTLFWLATWVSTDTRLKALSLSPYDRSSHTISALYESYEMLATLFCATACGLGVGWLMSGLLRSAAIASAVAIGLPLVLFLMTLIPSTDGRHDSPIWIFRLLTAAIGGAGFVVGTVVLLRRRGV